MTRSRATRALTLIATFFGALSASAQSGGPGEVSGGLRLLSHDQVQKDLGLTDQQRVQILTLSMESPEKRGNVSQQLAQILKPEQIQRLKQIRLQVGGPAALGVPEVADALGLSAEQRAALKDLRAQVGRQAQEITAGMDKLTPEDRTALMPQVLQKLDGIRKEITAKALEVLTPQQRDKFAKMQGAKLNFDAPPPRPKAPAKKPPPTKDGAQQGTGPK